ncbi:hypothetical protein [Pseudomonas sp. TCU-HL1]|uniref:hypothetical protein n=1 Tax=Pseudomonas sp. TCU-HL1 TaxID=1856685 RepID=UPI00083E087F|nr:hypothetical protein [Pseudomonas sp. TCU-HL1]
MASEVHVNAETFEAASEEERLQVHEIMTKLRIMDPEDSFVPDDTVAAVDIPDLDALRQQPLPEVVEFGFPGNVLDAIGNAVGGASKEVCKSGCNKAADFALVVCALETAGTGLALCIAGAEAARALCRDRC